MTWFLIKRMESFVVCLYNREWKEIGAGQGSGRYRESRVYLKVLGEHVRSTSVFLNLFKLKDQ
jgi:hypothetical protein